MIFSNKEEFKKKVFVSFLGFFFFSFSLVATKDAFAEKKRVEKTAEVEEKILSWGEFAGDIGLGVIGSNIYTTLQLGVDIREGDVSAGIQTALRLKTVSFDQRRGSTVRKEDWDEPSDFAQIIRYLTYGKDLGFLSFGLNLGVLCPANIGHGTLMENYNSLVDLNYPHSGFQARLLHKYFGIDFIMDDFVMPKILAMRVEARIKGFSFGLTGMMDIKAPRVALLDEEDNRRISDTRKLMVQTDTLGFVGYDFSYTFGNKKGFWIKPYVDNNWAVGHGGGLHAGIKISGKLFSGKLRLTGRAEYRLGWNGYSPEYIDIFYDIQRYQVPLGSSWRERRDGAVDTKLTFLSFFPSVTHGAKWEVGMKYEKLFWMRGAYNLRQGPLGDMAFFEVGVPYGRRWVFSGLVAKTGLFDKDAFASSDGLLAGGEARVEFLRNFYVLGQFRYLYGLDDTGIYNGIVLANLAVGGRWGY